MSDVRPDIDLSTLRRAPSAPTSGMPRPRRRALRIVVPLLLVLGFAAILATSLGSLLRGAVDVTVSHPHAATGAGATAGAVLFQAAGWVEPDPFPTRVTALAPGVVKEMLVQESDAVRAGDPVARLVDDEAVLAGKAAGAALLRAQAERERAQAEADNARQSYDAALALGESVATARAELSGRTAEHERRKAAVAAGAAAVRVAEEEVALQRYLETNGAAGPRQVELAEAKLAEARGQLDTFRADADVAAAETQKAAARTRRLDRDQELRLEDRLRVATAKAALDLADAAVEQARVAAAEAGLRLDRMTVRAPAAGVVLQRLAGPGTNLGMRDVDPTVATLYDPSSLRIRVDVPQGDVAKAVPGQRTEILSEARQGRPYAGSILRVVHQADIQKVTLQVHVKVLDPDALLRPEMLCQVRFLARDGDAATSRPEGTATVLVDARLLLDDGRIWVVDAVSGRAHLRRVTAGAKRGDKIEVTDGLNLTDKLIDEGRDKVSEGSPVRIRKGS